MKYDQIHQLQLPEPTTLLLDDHVRLIKNECSRFLQQTSYPLIKNLDITPSFYKLKARYRKNDCSISEQYNNALHTNALLQKAIYINSNSFIGTNKYYMFPIDGFKFACNTTNTTTTQLENTGKLITDKSLISDLIQLTYNTTQLNEAILSNNEMLIYNIPYCYCVNVNSVDSYSRLLKNIITG
jgi:hypothetical protein